MTQTPPAVAAAGEAPMHPPAVATLSPGDLVRIDDRPQLWRFVDFHGPLARLAPATPRTGRIVHPERLTRVEAPR